MYQSESKTTVLQYLVTVQHFYFTLLYNFWFVVDSLYNVFYSKSKAVEQIQDKSIKWHLG